MLINEIGTEVDVVQLDSRRVDSTPDPKNRITMTMLLQATLVTVARPERVIAHASLSPAISTLNSSSDATAQEETTTRSDAA